VSSSRECYAVARMQQILNHVEYRSLGVSPVLTGHAADNGALPDERFLVR
jgi:hypothetical protein